MLGAKEGARRKPRLETWRGRYKAQVVDLARKDREGWDFQGSAKLGTTARGVTGGKLKEAEKRTWFSKSLSSGSSFH